MVLSVTVYMVLIVTVFNYVVLFFTVYMVLIGTVYNYMVLFFTVYDMVLFFYCIRYGFVCYCIYGLVCYCIIYGFVFTV